MLLKSKTLLFIAPFAFCASSFAQGGEGLQLLQQWDAPNPGSGFGFRYTPIDDIDGDGMADILITEVNGISGNVSYIVHVQSGASGALIRSHETVGSLTVTDRFGDSLAALGDVDGDGVSDYAIGAPSALIPAGAGFSIGGKVFVFSGATGAPVYEFNSPFLDANFGTSMVGLGDLDGDGLADFAASGPSADVGGFSAAGLIRIYSATGSTLMDLSGTASADLLGQHLSTGGDLDADGTQDLLAVSDSGVQAFSLATGSLLYSLDWKHAPMAFQGITAFLDDFDGDGRSDFLVSEPGRFSIGDAFPGRVYLYSGANASLLRIFSGFSIDDGYGTGLASGGDLNGDGVADFAIGAPYANPNQVGNGGLAFFYSGADGSLLYQFYGDVWSNALGNHLSCSHDFDGDGLADAVLGTGVPAWETGSPDGSVSIFTLANVDPFLSISQGSVDASVGGTVSFALDFPSAAGPHYQLLASFDTGDPIAHGGLMIPLSPQPFFDRMLTNPPSSFSAPNGLLDANGDATCTLTLAPGELSAYANRRLWFVAIAAGSGDVLTHTSIPIGLLINR